MEARTLPKAMGLIFQLDMNERRAETENFREGVRGLCPYGERCISEICLWK